jgi:hypothetical protein
LSPQVGGKLQVAGNCRQLFKFVGLFRHFTLLWC